MLDIINNVMAKIIYRVKHNEMPGMNCTISFVSGVIDEVELAVNRPGDWLGLFNLISIGMAEHLVKEILESNGYSFSQEKTNEKLAQFCKAYEYYKKVKYKVSAADTGKIKLIEVNRDILIAYFNSRLFAIAGPAGSPGNHSISNLVKYYNELKAEIAAAQTPGATNKFPSGYDKSFEAKLKPAELKAYWAHLRTLGYAPKRDRMDNVIDWVKQPR